MRINILAADEINRTFSPLGKRAESEQRIAAYREALEGLGPDQPGGIVMPEDGESLREVKMRLHRAARAGGNYIRFRRRAEDGGLLFRLQTPDEIARLRRRGRELAAARRRPSAPVGGYRRLVTG